MNFPPYYKERSFQLFFIGVLTGGVIAYILFLYMYGSLTERWIEENLELRAKVNSLEEVLENDRQEDEKHDREVLLVQEVNVELVNEQALRIDRFVSLQLKELVEEELRPLIGSKIESLSENRSLIFSSIENKMFHVENTSYKAKITHLTIAPKMLVSVELHITKR
ncbi:sporulation membrane protein YtrI [Salirhabdus salicampi]|uniref:sporulation membrane protein YtrI n=1 Tax=Salirhabdus salicampi TaxID=476102 RepID=UPI0020C3CBD6|nr:sporulation membrane protein YtrI [Salirhabdus salicampi]MCP8617107.1 hypothetical protein [Salirhabdus salicampi]